MTLQPIGFRGFTCFCTSYATDDNVGSVFISLIGRITANKAIWAALMSGYNLMEGQLHRISTAESTRYHTITKRLPKSRWEHRLVVHSQATERNLPGHDFYILDEELPFEAFWSRWNRALPLPARKEWTERMWTRGVEERLITQVQAEATVCWKISANSDKWAGIVTELVKGEIEP